MRTVQVPTIEQLSHGLCSMVRACSFHIDRYYYWPGCDQYWLHVIIVHNYAITCENGCYLKQLWNSRIS